MCQNQCTYYLAYVSHAEARWEALDYRASKSRSKAATELSVGARVQLGPEKHELWRTHPLLASPLRPGQGMEIAVIGKEGLRHPFKCTESYT
jgi:hypothetical protein